MPSKTSKNHVLLECLPKSERGYAEAELFDFAHAFAKDQALPGMVILLEGELGAGKSTFARGVLAALGSDQQSHGSPTFALIHEYRLDDRPQGIERLIHADLYRLKSEAEIEAAGLDALIWESGDASLILVEWASLWGEFEASLERGLAALRRTLVRIRLKRDPRDSERRFLEIEHLTPQTRR